MSNLMKLRKRVHDVIDPLWSKKKSKMFKTRGDLYAYMAMMLNLHPTHCHVSMMTEDDCERVLKLFGVDL